MNVLEPAQILERLQASAAVLVSRAVDAPQWHRSLEEAIAWSYELLTPRRQVVLRSLSVFRGGATLAAVEAGDRRESGASF